MATNLFKLDPKAKEKWRAAMTELARISKKDDAEGIQRMVTLSARRFVKNVAAVTAPATGTLDSSAKKRGEDAILSDVLKLALPAQAIGGHAAREAFSSGTELLAAHAASRVGSTGRVNPRNRREKLLVSMGDFNRVLRQLQSKVGWLAAGLNAAAQRLGFSLPAWIKRHGEKFGKIEVRATAHGISIRVIQNVPYADDVKGYERRWNFALNKEITALVKQVHTIHQRQAARAKARLK